MLKNKNLEFHHLTETGSETVQREEMQKSKRQVKQEVKAEKQEVNQELEREEKQIVKHKVK